MMPPVSQADFELHIDRVAAGGDGLGSAPDGRVTFVPGGLPGDVVAVSVVKEKKQFMRAEISEIIQPALGRVSPPCPHVAEGCGGCDWQHASETTQRDLRLAIIVDALRRIAKLDGVDVAMGPELSPTGYRTSVRAVIDQHRAGFRAARSHDVIVPSPCLVAHALIQELMAEADFGEAREVTIRVGARTGERLVHLDRAIAVVVPSDVVVSTSEQPRFIHEQVAGHTYRISGPSFFQCRPDGADVMVDLVAEAIEGISGPLVDAYAGVGLFGAALAGDRPLTAIESSASSADDARHNLPPHAEVVESTVEEWTATPAAAVVADPARRGLGAAGARTLLATGAEAIALVSCDPAAMARDLRLLVDGGYDVRWVRVLDLFGHTSHVEAVSCLRRRSA